MGALGLAAVEPARAQQTIYAIADGGASLIRFQSNNPGAVTVVGNFSGANTFLDAIDFRPLNGQLYGYLDSTNSLYTVNLATAALTLVGASAAATNTFQLGMDFNPTIDRLRIVTDSDQNIVLNPANAGSTVATNLDFAVGDLNDGEDPNVIDVAYTGNIAGSGLPSQQYGIDYGLDILVTVANNAGTLNTIGSLGVDTSEFVGFDIFTAGTMNTAYALLTVGGTPGLYNINLGTGAATSIGTVGATGVYSLAVVPGAAVPEPGAVAMGAGILATVLGVAARRRRRA
jgi:hypothetical protein